MYNVNIPSDREIPSTKKLIKSTIIAAITAGVLLVTVVMPAEYGIDPTGIGKAVGLQKMGEIKKSLAEEAITDLKNKPAQEKIAIIVPETAPLTTQIQILNHEMKFTLAPNEGTEIKVGMNKGGIVKYLWWTDGGKVNFDVHGDSKILKIDYHSYVKGSGKRKEDSIEAAFDGYHGWFWRNRTSGDVTITLQTNGEYIDIKRIK